MKSRTHAFSRLLLPMLAFTAGLLFGVGLLVSELTDPAKVTAFLDVAGAWDPSLLFTMGASIAVGLAAFAVARRRQSTLIGLPLHLPTSTLIDRRLVFGGVLFGIGWGLAGICPGPSLVVLGTGSRHAAIFVVAMLAGMALFDRAARRWQRSTTRQASHEERAAGVPAEPGVPTRPGDA